MVQAKDVNSYAEYRQYISEIVDIMIEESENYEDYDIQEDIFSQVDNSRMIMFYSNNLTVLEYSENQPEEWKHLVSESDYWKDVIQGMAFDVMRQDIYEELQSRDIDF